MKTVNKEVNKDKALEQVLNDIEKQFGKGAIMKLGDNKHMKVDVVLLMQSMRWIQYMLKI